MARIVVTCVIDAPIDVVFNTVAHIQQFSAALPHIVNFEFLSDSETGIGTRFRETRVMNGKDMDTELEVVEYVLNDHTRMVADSHGTIWDTLFSVTEAAGQTTLTMTMDARAYRLLPKLVNLLFNRMIKKVVERDMGLVKTFCEKGATVSEE